MQSGLILHLQQNFLFIEYFALLCENKATKNKNPPVQYVNVNSNFTPLKEFCHRDIIISMNIADYYY